MLLDYRIMYDDKRIKLIVLKCLSTLGQKLYRLSKNNLQSIILKIMM